MARFRIKRPYNKQHISNAIINEWITAKREGRNVDPVKIQDAVTPIIDETNFMVVANLDTGQGQKVININVPAPGASQANLEAWINQKWPTQEELEEFGRICLYGCGR